MAGKPLGALSVLVTGGAGYIGSHAAKALARAGSRVIVFDNLVAGHREAVKYGELVEGDIADTEALRARVAAAYRKAGAGSVEGFRKVLLNIIASPDDRRRFDRAKPNRR